MRTAWRRPAPGCAGVYRDSECIRVVADTVGKSSVGCGGLDGASFGDSDVDATLANDGIGSSGQAHPMKGWGRGACEVGLGLGHADT